VSDTPTLKVDQEVRTPKGDGFVVGTYLSKGERWVRVKIVRGKIEPFAEKDCRLIER
jgi:hypothetical protein